MAAEAMGNQIRIPQGDTGVVKFVYDKSEVAETDKAIFTVASQNGNAMLRKILEPNEGDSAFHLPFTHEETAAIKPGAYDWSLRVVRGGVFDANGRLTSAQGSHTTILKGRLTILSVAGGAR